VYKHRNEASQRICNSLIPRLLIPARLAGMTCFLDGINTRNVAFPKMKACSFFEGSKYLNFSILTILTYFNFFKGEALKIRCLKHETWLSWILIQRD